MAKLQNASNNIEEMCQAAIEGEQLQAKADGEWVDTHPYILFTAWGQAGEWRVKPDALYLAWDIYEKESVELGNTYVDFDDFKAGWNAAIAHKEREND